MSLGHRLREERLRLKLDQESFGALGGVKALAQRHYEQGKRSPDAKYLAAIAAAGVDIQYVITGPRSASVDAALLRYADGRQILDEALREQALLLPPDKMRRAADALYQLRQDEQDKDKALAVALALLVA